MFDFEHKTDPETGENKLFILMERGDCDLESIVKKLIKQKDLTPAKLRFYWEEMLEVGRFPLLFREAMFQRYLNVNKKPHIASPGASFTKLCTSLFFDFWC